MGWRLDATIVCSGLLVIVYTVAGGSDAVNLTQKYQIGVIFAGMVAAFFVLLSRLPAGLTLADALTLAGRIPQAGGGRFLHGRGPALHVLVGPARAACSSRSRISAPTSRRSSATSRAASLRESRLGLMFNAVFKIPMQFFILLLGVLIFVFYQFERPPVFFNQAAWKHAGADGRRAGFARWIAQFGAAHAAERAQIEAWLGAGTRATGQGEAAAEAGRLERARAGRGGARRDAGGAGRGIARRPRQTTPTTSSSPSSWTTFRTA